MKVSRLAFLFALMLLPCFPHVSAAQDEQAVEDHIESEMPVQAPTQSQGDNQAAPPAASSDTAPSNPAAGQSPSAASVAEQQSEIQVDGQSAPPDQVLPPVPELAPAKMEDMKYAVLRTIDKLSARTHTFDVAVDKTVKFGNSLFIKLRACRKSSPIDQPESAAFLQIWEKKTPDDQPHWVFSGWMFASSPSLSAMDHPVYDVWVIECKNDETSAKPASAPAPAPAKPAGKKPAPADDTPADDDAAAADEEPPPSAE